MAEGPFDRLGSVNIPALISGEESRGSYSRAKKALQERFDPDSKCERYAVKLNTRRRHKGEGWADFAEDLRRLADKVYPDLQEEARTSRPQQLPQPTGRPPGVR